jgi:hypothetical protein
MLRRKEMKQIIVLIAMILLGISIGGFVMDFSDSAKTISDSTSDKVEHLTTSEAFE